MESRRRHFTIAHKILLIATSFSLPIAVLAYFVTSAIDVNIDFGAKEIEGNTYQRPCEALLHGLQSHQLAAHEIQDGWGEGSTTLTTAKSAVDVAFDALEAADRRVGVDLQFTDEGLGKRDRAHIRIPTVRAEWKELASAVAEQAKSGKLTADVDARYDHLLADVRTMITHSGDTSNLILDPDLDSYYMMDVTLLALPQTQDRVARVLAYGAGVAAKDAPSPAERIQLAVHAAMLQEADHDRIVASSQTALNEDRNFYGTSDSFQREVPSSLESYKKDTAVFIAMVKELASAEKPSIDRATFAAAGMKALDAAYDYWETADRQLDVLLANRVGILAGSKQWALALSFAAVVAASVLSYFMMRSITQPLDGLVGSLGPGADLLAGCVESISETSRGEATIPADAAIICEELNAHADDMRKAVRELVSLVAGSAAADRIIHDAPARPVVAPARNTK